jgi:acetyl-CoA/propionyl-CoA carboxylase biotin carboxyl carrier protein
MFKKVLIANRSEIAVRVINACRELAVTPVAIYSHVDRLARHVQLTDENYLLEGDPASVYLDINQIISLAKRSGAEAIHPGYGFLSENANFARACSENGISFIGPEANVIAKLGSKVEFRKSMQEAGVPVVPGTIDPVADTVAVLELAKKWGYPVAIKASAGGGGRGFRLARSDDEVEAALAAAQREGQSYFGNKEVYLEKYLADPRHIEVQILADSFGNVAHLGERDCSVQRRHQKLLEETPSPILTSAARKQAIAAAVQAATAVGYTSAGTFEGLISEGKYYLLEVNTRVQVEHPISEMVTGVDIVKEQIRIAAGERLSFKQDEVEFRGHAIECRINAEDPSRNFLPSPGTIVKYAEPRLPWVRVDSACYQGYKVQPFYDSLLAKLVVWGRTREEAIARTHLALENYLIEGVATTIPFHTYLLKDKRFLSGNLFTDSVEGQILDEFKKSNSISVRSTSASLDSDDNSDIRPVVAPIVDSQAPGERADHFFQVTVRNRTFRVGVSEVFDKATVDSVKAPPRNSQSASTSNQASQAISAKERQEVKAPMHGLVKEVHVSTGDYVEAGEHLLIFEAMKMESTINAEISGRVEKISVKVGQTVGESDHLLTVRNEPKDKRSGRSENKHKRKR